MSNTSSGLLGFAIGAGIGSGLTYYFTRRYLTKIMLSTAIDIANDRINDLIDSGVLIEADSEQEDDESEESSEGDLSTVSSITKEYWTKDKNDVVDYHALYNKKDPGEIMAERQHPMDDGELPDDMSEDERSEIEGEQLNDEIAGDRRLHKDRPYRISQEQFAEERNEYDKETLYGYSDGVIAHENDEIVDDIEQLIGNIDDCLGKVDITLYVRNDRFGSDYEVIFVDQTYQETVDGISPEPDWAD